MQLLVFSTIFIFGLFVFGDAQDATRCAGSSDAGLPCHAHKGPPVQKFFFDLRTSVCQPFIYNGCYGNGNRFDTAAQCRTACASFAARSPATNTAKNATGTCPGGSAPSAVGGVPAKCVTSRNCTSGYGCSKGACCPNKANICKLMYESGKERPEDESHFKRYYYNAEFKGCMVFSYFGLEGNANNFETYSDCIDFCS
uniref:BPTI/Kunitz inhibitor domain-containing protein n=1 Tax=Plectus sambesii TaxID=2011161 RepID=A0A914W7I8_9BILA